MKENSMIIATEAQSIVTGIQNAANEIFHSFTVETMEDKIKLFNATNGDGQTIKENVNKVLEVVDVVIMPVEVKDEDGSTSTVPRTTLITKKGDLISATSWGVYNSVKKINAIFGSLHFEGGIKISPVEVKTKGGFTINLKLV